MESSEVTDYIDQANPPKEVLSVIVSDVEDIFIQFINKQVALNLMFQELFIYYDKFGSRGELIKSFDYKKRNFDYYNKELFKTIFFMGYL